MNQTRIWNSRRRLLAVLTMLAVTALPLTAAGQGERSGDAQALTPADTGNPTWDEEFMEEYEGLLSESGIPPEVASLVLSRLPEEAGSSDPVAAAAIAMRETSRVDAAVRRGSLPNRAAAEAQRRLENSLASAAETRTQERGRSEAGRGNRARGAPGGRSNRALESLERGRGPREPNQTGPPASRGGGPPRLPDGVERGGEGPPDGPSSGTPGPPDPPGRSTVDRS
jgi:hypothetical protein